MRKLLFGFILLTLQGQAKINANLPTEDFPLKSVNPDPTLYTYVPDDNFQQALRDKGIDQSNIDDYVLTSALQAVTELDVSNLNISDLTGIEDFSSLDGFFCSGNNLEKLDVSRNSQLVSLYCDYCGLKNLDVSQNLKLVTLIANSNEIQTINLSKNAELATLSLHDNPLTDLDITKLTNIRSLYVDHCNLSSIVISTNLNLSMFKCDNNQLTTLDLSKHSFIDYLSCSNNLLTQLNLKNGNNQFLSRLFAYDNPNLSCIQVDDVNYAQQAIGWSKDAHTIYSENCGSVNPDPSLYTYVPDDNFQKALRDQGIDQSNIDDYVLTSALQTVTELDVSGLNISDLTGIEAFTNLQNLKCYENKLTSLNISKNIALNVLECQNNKIPSFDFSNNKNLLDLDVSENVLEGLDVSNNLDLRELRAANCGLHSIDVSHNTNLSVIWLDNNQIQSIDLSKNNDLSLLGIRFNPLIDLDISNQIKLESLFISGCSLSSINLSTNQALEVIECRFSSFQTLDLSKQTHLHSLDCSNNMLEQLNLKNGSNSFLSDFDASSNPSLYCIQVDDVNYAQQADTWLKDARTIYSENCGTLPQIVSVSETTVCEGETINITGVNLETTQSVRCGEVPVKSFTIISPTNLSVVVGKENSGDLVVTTNFGEVKYSGVSVESKPTPAGNISGNTLICQGQQGRYAIPVIDNATSYIWTLPPGANGVDNSNVLNIKYDPPSTSGNVVVKGVNSCGEGPSSTLAVEVKVLPVGPETISGSAAVCPNEKMVTYQVAAVAGANSYKWTLPTGATGSSVTNNITVDYDANATSGGISVQAVNDCGEGPKSTLAVTVSTLPADAGTIIGKTNVCQGDQEVSYSVAPIDQATDYIWKLPNGVSGSSTSKTIRVDFGKTASSGTIEVKGQNSCGLGKGSILPITANPVPATPIISLNNQQLESSISVGNQWFYNNIPIDGAIQPTYIPKQFGNYTSLVTQNGCSSESSNVIVFSKEGSNLKLFPNPTNGFIHITGFPSSRHIILTITDLNGKILMNKKLMTSSDITVDVSRFPAGIYILDVEDNFLLQSFKVNKIN